MEVIELTQENIENYLAGCVETQKFLFESERPIDPEQFRKTAIADHSYFLAAVENGRVAGMCVVNKIEHPVRTDAYVDNMVVHEDFRGLGLFSTLMDSVEKKAQEWGAEKAKLTCSRPAVQPLYERRGYKAKDTKYYTKEL